MDENKQIEALAATICSYLRSDSMSRALASLLYEEGWRKDEKLLINDGKSNNSDFKSNKWDEEMLEIIADAIETYANDVTDHTENEYIREGLLNAGYVKQSEGEWISVKDALPEEDVRVLVWLSEKNPSKYTRIDTDRMLGDKWVRWMCYVTHWMPLPEPPKMKGANDERK